MSHKSTSTLGTPAEPSIGGEAGKFAIRAVGIEKDYRRGNNVTTVLRGVDLDVASGECVFLAGPSGSGKTTLLSIFGCILTADRGEISILGHDLNRLDQATRRNLRLHHIGFVFQRFHLVRGLSALDNVCVPLILSRVSRSRAKRRGREILARVGLDDQKHKSPKELSVGECQRVALARAMVTDPTLILADEPTASLDGANGQVAMKLLLQMTREQGKSLVVVTHDSRIFPYADRICHMENGQLIDSPDSNDTPVSANNGPRGEACCEH